jgi:predicted ATP-dependent serine protease
LSALDGGRRTKLVMFTCNRCGGRTARLTNPLAWEKGAVFARCQHCDVWHTLAANNPKIIEEIRYDDPEGQKRRREAFYAASQQQQQQEEASSGSGDSDGTVVFGGDEGGVDSSNSGPASAPPQQPIV